MRPAIDVVSPRAYQAASVRAYDRSPTLVQDSLAREFWKWYGENINDEVLTVTVWGLRKTLRVRDLRPLFVRLFGEPDPESAGGEL